jgi:alkylation response protein AidB-like acyl-CoA dehydrogenase
MTYTAPIAAITRALHAHGRIDDLIATGAFPNFDRDLISPILEEAGKLANEVLAPLNQVGHQTGAKLTETGVATAPGFAQAYARYREGGWMGLAFPEAYGGQGLPRVMALAVMEMMHSANMAFALCPMLSLGAIEALLAHGTDEQKSIYLPKLVSGEWTGAMNLTEPQAGSDVGALRTKASPNGDGSYAITGQKIYITWGDHDVAGNIVQLVLARLPDAPEGSRGVSLFLAPKFLVNANGSLGARNALRCIGLEHKMGIHASPTCVMEYDGAKAWLIGEPNRGLAAMFTMMNSARLNVGLEGVAVGEAAFQAARAYAEERRQGAARGVDGQAAIIRHPDVQRMLAKAWSTDRGVETANAGVQIHGGMGFMGQTLAAQLYLDARIAPIYEGTNGIQAIDLVGRKLSGDGGTAMAALIAEARGHAYAARNTNDPRLVAASARLDGAAEALESATTWMLETMRDDRETALGGATRYLRLAGDVAGGALLVAGAIGAMPGEDDPAGLERARALARFFAEDTLSQAQGRLAAITDASAALREDAAILVGAFD